MFKAPSSKHQSRSQSQIPRTECPLVTSPFARALVSAILALLSFGLGDAPILAQQDRSQALELYQSAVALLELGDFAGAEQKIETLLVDFPGIPQALNVAGIIADLREKPEKAIEYFESALSVRDDFIDARSNLARLYTKTRQYEEAKRQFQEVLQFDPAHGPSLKGLAEVRYETGDFEAALESATHALAQLPQDPDLLLLLARTQFKLKREEEAAETTRRLKELFA